MGMQPHDATVAINEGVNPSQAVMCRGDGQETFFATPNIAVLLAPGLEQVRQGGEGWRYMLADLHISLAQLPRIDDFTVGGNKVALGQSFEQFCMHCLHGLHLVNAGDGGFVGIGDLERAFGVHMGQSHSLAGRQFRLG